MIDPGSEAPAAGEATGAIGGGDEAPRAGSDANAIQKEGAAQAQDMGIVSELTAIPAVAAYTSRIGARARSLRKLVVEERGGRYSRTVAEITFGDAGEITSPDEYAPTDAEAAAIREAWKRYRWPEYQPCLHTGRHPPSGDNVRWSEADPDNLAICWDREHTHILAVEERRSRDDGGKDIFVWTYWSDSRWRIAEPPEGLPLFGLDTIQNAATIFIHEGPKAAKAVQALIADDGDAGWKTHPWGAELRGSMPGAVAHVGWMGGAERPGATDWQPIIDAHTRAVMVCDNDRAGKDSARQISRRLRIEAQALFFDDEWPIGFDLADPIPEKLYTVRKGRRVYVGPRLESLLRPATWATDVLPAEGRGRPSYAPRSDCVAEWMLSVSPPLYFHRSRPSEGHTEAGVNMRLRAFSDAEDTARLLRQRPSVIADGITYAPGFAEGIITQEGKQLINTWAGSTIPALPGSWWPFGRFLTYLIPDKADRFEIMRWCATLIACPSTHMEYALLLRSETQGIGKTTLADILAHLVGHDNVSMPGEAALAEGSFNSFMARKRLVICNEFYSNQSVKTYNRMKSWITDKTIHVNEKYQPEYDIANHAHFFFCSNDLVPILLVETDRRFFIPTVTEKKKSRAYWSAFYDWLAAEGLGIIRRWAIEFVAKHPPVRAGEAAPSSTGKAELIERSLLDEVRLVRDVGEELVARGAADPPERIMVTLDDFRAWLSRREDKGRTRIKRQSIQDGLRKAGLTVRSRDDRAGVDNRVHVAGRKQVVIVNFDLQPGETWPEVIRAGCLRSMDLMMPGELF